MTTPMATPTEPTPEYAVHSVWYRSVLPDGSVWCESSSAAEVYDRSKGLECTYWTMTTWLVKGPWRLWHGRVKGP